MKGYKNSVCAYNWQCRVTLLCYLFMLEAILCLDERGVFINSMTEPLGSIRHGADDGSYENDES